MGGYALLICRSQTEAIGLRRHLARLGVPGEVARPPRHERTESCGWAVRVRDRKSTRLNSSHLARSRMPSSA